MNHKHLVVGIEMTPLGYNHDIDRYSVSNKSN